MNGMEIKSLAHVQDEEAHSRNESPKATHSSNHYDEQDMYRMGKKQELRRNFKIFSIFGFVSILQATWESTLLASSFGLENGGTAGIIWLTVVTWLCFLAMIASMSEMASMAPTAYVLHED